MTRLALLAALIAAGPAAAQPPKLPAELEKPLELFKGGKFDEALDALQKGVASAEDIDTAMRLGVNYPRGPLAWGESLGWGRVLRLLENLQQHYGEERYRPCSLLRQKALMERHHEQ